MPPACLEPTYKGLKHRDIPDLQDGSRRLEPTYKGLKLAIEGDTVRLTEEFGAYL